MEAGGGSTVTFAAGDNPTAAELNDLAPRYAYKSSDETVNNTATLQSDDFLLLDVAASTRYEFELYITYTSNTTPDLKLGWTLPTGASNSYVYQFFDGATWVASSGATVPTAGVAIGGFGAALPARFQGVITISTTAGTMQIVWAQNTANASNTTIHAGSYLRVL